MSGAVSVRAGIVVTGTEVLTGRVQDRNGPWLADRLLELGVELAHITICGDRPEDIDAQLRFMADEGVDLIVTSGGLGPDRRRHDGRDRRPVRRARAGARRGARGADRGDPAAADGALQPLGPRGRARRQPQAGAGPGGRHRHRPGGHRAGRGGARQADRRRAPGPAARAPADVARRPWTRDAVPRGGRRAHDYRQQTCASSACRSPSSRRRCARPRSEIAGFERARDHHLSAAGEVEVVTRYEPDARRATRSWSTLRRASATGTLFSTDGSLVDDQVAAAARRPHGSPPRSRAPAGCWRRA